MTDEHCVMCIPIHATQLAHRILLTVRSLTYPIVSRTLHYGEHPSSTMHYTMLLIDTLAAAPVVEQCSLLALHCEYVAPLTVRAWSDEDPLLHYGVGRDHEKVWMRILHEQVQDKIVWLRDDHDQEHLVGSGPAHVVWPRSTATSRGTQTRDSSTIAFAADCTGASACLSTSPARTRNADAPTHTPPSPND